MPPAKLALRDLLVSSVTLGLWCLEFRVAPEGGSSALAVGIVASLMTALTGFLLHEWGHLAGSLLGGSVVHYADRLLAPLLFDFDVEANDSSQFLRMSYGGYVGSLLGLLLVFLLAPLGRLSGQLAFGLALLGFVASVILEGPTTVMVLRGEDPPEPLVRTGRKEH